MVASETITGLPLRALERSTKNVVFELADGKRFLVLGGKNRRPQKSGVAGFTPAEMIRILNEGIDEEAFRALILIKEKMGPRSYIQGIERDSGATP